MGFTNEEENIKTDLIDMALYNKHEGEFLNTGKFNSLYFASFKDSEMVQTE
jgi:hypothetical protein